MPKNSLLKKLDNAIERATPGLRACHYEGAANDLREVREALIALVEHDRAATELLDRARKTIVASMEFRVRFGPDSTLLRDIRAHLDGPAYTCGACDHTTRMAQVIAADGCCPACGALAMTKSTR